MKGWISGLFVYLLSSILVPESGSAFLIRIRIRIQHTFFYKYTFKIFKKKKILRITNDLDRNYSNISAVFAVPVPGTPFFFPGAYVRLSGGGFEVYIIEEMRRESPGESCGRGAIERKLSGFPQSLFSLTTVHPSLQCPS